MLCASRLAERLGRDRRRGDGARQQALLAALGLPRRRPRDWRARPILDVMRHDKKVEHGRLRFVLPSRMGHVELVGDVSPDDVRAALTAD